MNPAFQVHHFHGIFIFAMNQPMVTALDEQFQAADDDNESVKEFKRAIQRQKVNYQSEDGRPQLRSYKFNGPVILHLNAQVAIDVSDHLAQYEELPVHVYAFREKLGDRLRYVRQQYEEETHIEAAA